MPTDVSYIRLLIKPEHKETWPGIVFYARSVNHEVVAVPIPEHKPRPQQLRGVEQVLREGQVSKTAVEQLVAKACEPLLPHGLF